MDNNDVRDILSILHGIMRYTHNKISSEDIPRAEFFVMSLINDACSENNKSCQKGITVTKISKILFSAPANTSRILSNLEEKGYIERTDDPADRRVVYISLSKKGKAVIEKQKKKTEEYFLDIFKKMGEREAEQYLLLNKKLFGILQREQSAAPDAERRDKHI